jgi:NDP-sugar pyrophosphorylase family protein
MAKTILFMAANAKDTPRLRLDQEVREIDGGLQRAKNRDEFVLRQQWATRPIDARRAMLDFKPNFVHFCGHGQRDGIAFEDDSGYAKLTIAPTLAGFFELFADQVECVFLNACYSDVQAQAIAQHINYVIGIRSGIEDKVAIEFAVAFYDAIGAGESIEFAYRLACIAIQFQWPGISSDLMPILVKKDAVKIEQIDCIVLCGGYSTRLWPLTIDISKVLLPVSGKPVLEYNLDFIQESYGIGSVILSVNQKFESQIRRFVETYKSKVQQNHSVEVIVEPTTQEKEKLGPIGALDYIISNSAPRDLIVLGGDNIFGFQLDKFIQFGTNAAIPYSYNAVYEYQAQDDLTEYGTVNIDSAGNFLEFREKSKRYIFNNVSTACYYFRNWDVEAIYKYIQDGQDADSLGGFIHWLLTEHHSHIGSFLFSSFWFDIGTRDTLLEANKYFLVHSLLGNISKTDFKEPTYISKNATVIESKLGPNVYVGDGAHIVNSTVSNSIVMEQCIIQKSIVNNSVIGPGSVIEGQILDTVCGPKSKFAM